jgi:hypothetical protein
MLPAMFVLRRDRRSTTRHAATAIALGALLTTAVLVLTSPEALNRYFSSFEWSEQEYQRGLANDQIGRYQYPGTAYRQLVTPKTVDERREQHARFMVWLEEQRAKVAPPTWREKANRMQPAVLAILFGIMGWTLAGIGSPSIPRAMMWWLLIYLTTLGFGGLLASVVGEMSFWSAQDSVLDGNSRHRGDHGKSDLRISAFGTSGTLGTYLTTQAVRVVPKERAGAGVRRRCRSSARCHAMAHQLVAPQQLAAARIKRQQVAVGIAAEEQT